MKERLARLQGMLEEPLLVTNPTNVTYLCGLSSSNAAILVEPGRVQLYTDFRYFERAEAIVSVEAVQTRRNLYADLAERPRRPDRLRIRCDHRGSLPRAQRGRPGVVARRGLVEQLREVKDSAELAAIRRSAEILTAALRSLAEGQVVGRSEREIAWDLVQRMHELGAEDAAFSAVVAGGVAAASPHAVPSDRRIEVGEMVVVDAGCKVNGYCSDCTRTFSTGKVPAELEEAYAVVLEAQLAGLAAVRPGAIGNGRRCASRAR